MSHENPKESQTNGSGRMNEAVCRDFLRNVCRRGATCKYLHPLSEDGDDGSKARDYIFCHDYQNKECGRPSCKFLHCTREEEEYYHSTGTLPPHILEEIASGKQLASTDLPVKGEIPICKDFLKGECRRRNRCKFRHISNSEFSNDAPYGSTLRRKREFPHDIPSRFNSFDDYEPEMRRRAFDDSYGRVASERSFRARNHDTVPSLNDFRMLEEENAILRRQLDDLHKQLADLTATNEFLLDQNAQLRLSKQSTPITQALIPHTITSTVTPIPPSITHIAQQIPINSGDLTAAGLAPVSMASVSIAQPLVSQSLPQSIITSTPLISYPIMTQSMRPVIPHSLGGQ